MDFDNNGNIKCDYCRGDKIILKSVSIHEVCPRCNGAGGEDWIIHAMGRKPNATHITHDVVQRNIFKMIQLIKEEGLKLGINMIVTIEQEPDYRYHQGYQYNSYYMRKSECIDRDSDIWLSKKVKL